MSQVCSGGSGQATRRNASALWTADGVAPRGVADFCHLALLL